MKRLFNDYDLFTILMPTKDRSSYFRRSLQFLKDQDFYGQLLVVDGSVVEGNITHNKRMVDEVYTDMNIVYVHTGDMGSPWHEMRHGLKEITSKYILFYSDDDFYFLDEVDKCIDFLEKNGDYSSAKGRFFKIWFGEYEKVELAIQPMYSYTADTSEQRVDDMLSEYCHLFFSVLYREDFYHISDYVPRYLEQGWFDQFAQTCILGIRGKAHTFDDLYCIRQSHQQQTHVKRLRSDPYADWPMLVSSPNFSKLHQDFRRCLIDSCQGYVSIDNEQLGSIIDRGLVSILGSRFEGQKFTKQDIDLLDQLRDTGSVAKQKVRKVFNYIVGQH